MKALFSRKKNLEKQIFLPLFLAALFLLGGCSDNIFSGLQDGDSSNNIEELVKSGEARLLAGDNEGALKAFNQALAIKSDYAPALRGKVSALLNIAAPSGSFAADFSQLITSSEDSEDLSENLDFSLDTWEKVSAASETGYDLLNQIGDLNESDKLNISILSVSRIISKVMITQLKIEEISGSDIDGLESDYSNLGDFIDFANTDCSLNPTDDACTSEKLSGDEALALIDDAIASGELPEGTDTDFSETLSEQLSDIRCELCFPDCSGSTPPSFCTGYVQPADCGDISDYPECSE